MREVQRHHEHLFVFGHEFAVALHRGAHLERDALTQHVEVDNPRAELVLGAVHADPTLAFVAPRSRQLRAPVLQPELPPVGRRVRDLVVENEKATGLELLVQPSQAFGVVLALTAEPEPAAEDDRPVAAGNVELVQRLRVEARRLQAFTLGSLEAELEHVG